MGDGSGSTQTTRAERQGWSRLRLPPGRLIFGHSLWAPVERVFDREQSTLGDVFELLDAFVASERLPPETAFPLTMAVEELYTNMVKYNAGGGDILIRCAADDRHAEITMVDSGAAPFDITRDRGVDVEASLEERTPGGLGLHLVQRMMDELHYDHHDGSNHIRIVKYRQRPVEHAGNTY